jgi:hypothetical protein
MQIGNNEHISTVISTIGGWHTLLSTQTNVIELPGAASPRFLKGAGLDVTPSTATAKHTKKICGCLSSRAFRIVTIDVWPGLEIARPGAASTLRHYRSHPGMRFSVRATPAKEVTILKWTLPGFIPSAFRGSRETMMLARLDGLIGMEAHYLLEPREVE